MLNRIRRWLLGRVETRVVEVTKDRRTVALREALRKARQDAADRALEREWRERVAVNEARRSALKALEWPFERQAG